VSAMEYIIQQQRRSTAVSLNEMQLRRQYCETMVIEKVVAFSLFIRRHAVEQLHGVSRNSLRINSLKVVRVARYPSI
jgi:hypothetical protein